MKKAMIAAFIFFPVIVFSQVVLKGGAGAGNRWNEAFNSQTAGKGFRAAAEKFIVPQFSVGVGISYFSFDPNELVNVKFNSYSLQSTWYFNTKKWQPYLGAAVGYTRYKDKTSIALGGGIYNTQVRKKNYAVASPYLGLNYGLGKLQRAGIFLQLNADFIPVQKIQPIGFVSLEAGYYYRLHTH